MYRRHLAALVALLLLCLVPEAGQTKVSAIDIIGNASPGTDHDRDIWLGHVLRGLEIYDRSGLAGLADHIAGVEAAMDGGTPDADVARDLPAPVDRMRRLCAVDRLISALLIGAIPDSTEPDWLQGCELQWALEEFLVANIDGYRDREETIRAIVGHALMPVVLAFER